jgi:hypothetical protein
MTDAPTPQPNDSNSTDSVVARKRADRKRKRRVELAGAIIIAIAAVLTAIATFQSGDADGTVEEKNTQGVGLILDANDAYNQYDAARLVERDWVFGWIAEAANDQPAADILEAAMPEEIADLINEWLDANVEFFDNPEAEFIDDPFTESYASFAPLPSNELLEIGDFFYNAAQCAFFEAQEAAVRGDGLGLSTVFLAIALVVGGIAALLNGKAAQIIVITIASLSLVAGAGQLMLSADTEEVRAVAAAQFFANEDGSDILTDDFGVPLDIQEALDIVESLCGDLTLE